jgi:DnaJ-class molecular chaperone
MNLCACLYVLLLHSTQGSPHDYRLLGVRAVADLETVKSAYRKMAMEWHPDRNIHPDASSRFLAISDAYARIKAQLTKTADETPDQVDPFQMFKDMMGSSFSFSFSTGSAKVSGTSHSSSTTIQNSKEVTRKSVTDLGSGRTETTIIEEDLTTGGQQVNKVVTNPNEKSVEL